MARWSLSNKSLPISHKQFVALTLQFKEAAEQSFGTMCVLQIRVLSAPKLFPTFCARDADKRNEENTLLETACLGAVSRALWTRAAHVEVAIRPVDERRAQAYAFAHVEFKGAHPKRATFHVRPDGKDAREAILAQNRNKIRGDGFASHGTRADSIPSSFLARLLPL